MTSRKIISTPNAPKAIGTYSQAVKVGEIVYLSGQIPLDPVSMILVNTSFHDQAVQVFNNLDAVCKASGGSLQQIAKLTVYLVDLENFSFFNQVMETFFSAPYPARAVVGVHRLPKDAQLEIDAVLHLN